MAKFEMELPTEIMKDFEKIYKDSEKIFGEMTMAGAERVMYNMKKNAPNILKPYVRTTKMYKTPTDGGINTKAYISGYIPFSDPNRKYFSARNGTTSKVYKTSQGVPAEFLANLYEYGRSTAPFPKHPFMRKSFNKNEIEQEMLKAQKRASGGLLE